jgi:TetR/AcrR family transcriptional repressor of nem operon
MPRVSREQAEKNHELIEEVSARLFKERGFSGVSVADLMATAGLTHGGFYGHFASKDELAAAACARSFGQTTLRWQQKAQEPCAEGEKGARLAKFFDDYLSSANVNKSSCPAVSFSSDVAREPDDKPVRRTYAVGLEGMAGALEQMSPAREPGLKRQQALAQLSTLIGAMTLARATRGDPLSDEILLAARALLTGRLALDDEPA